MGTRPDVKACSCEWCPGGGAYPCVARPAEGDETASLLPLLAAWTSPASGPS